MFRFLRLHRLSALLILILLIAAPAHAQDGSGSSAASPGEASPGGMMIHVVQRGENLFRIAIRYGTTIEDIAAANGISNAAVISVGQRLLIPNAAPGTPGIPTDYIVTPGDSLFNLAARFGTTAQAIAQRNLITNPARLFVGQELALQEGSASGEAGIQSGWIHVVAPQDTLYRIAVRYAVSPAALLYVNRMTRPTAIYPGQRLIIPGPPDGPSPVDLPAPFVSAVLEPAQPEQGRTFLLRLVTAAPALLEATFIGQTLTAFSDESRTQHVILVGVDALYPPGIYPLIVRAIEDDGTHITLSRPLLIRDGGYGQETIRLAANQGDLLNPAVTEPETARVQQIVSLVTPTRYFGGPMGLPCPAPVTSQFGTRRSYNGGAFDRLHTGTDFAAMPGAAIYAPAPGVVVLAEPLTVRGNATIIDHGWGIYTGYWHQQDFSVRVGEFVQQGQVIGTIGQTGRVTGPHLHWELFVNGVQVDPLQWTRMSFP